MKLIESLCPAGGTLALCAVNQRKFKSIPPILPFWIGELIDLLCWLPLPCRAAVAAWCAIQQFQLNSWFVLFHFTSFHSTKTNSFKFNWIASFIMICGLLSWLCLFPLGGANGGEPPLTHQKNQKPKQAGLHSLFHSLTNKFKEFHLFVCSLLARSPTNGTATHSILNQSSLKIDGIELLDCSLGPQCPSILLSFLWVAH